MFRQNWLYWRHALDVSPILEAADRRMTEDATTFGGANLDHRRSKVAWLDHEESILKMISPFAMGAAEHMGIDILPRSQLQYTEYHGSEGGKYDWHHDVDWNNSEGLDRKLSVTVQLSDPTDYTGGEFEFQEVEQPKPECRDKGTVLVFPSYLQHRVLPVTSGVRKTLVAWFVGPRWR